MNNIEKKAASVGNIIGFVVGIGLAFVVAYIFSIEPSKEYGWFAGIWHGIWFIPNYIISLFSDNYYFKAPMHTTAYNVFWYINAIWASIFYLNLILKIIGNIRTLSK